MDRHHDDGSAHAVNRPARKRCRRRRLINLFALALLALLMGLYGCSGKQPPEKTETHPATPAPTALFDGTIVAMGDSLTAGLGVPPEEAYPAQLERRLQAAGHHYRVINAGVSGETSSGALSRVDWVIESLSPDIVILETGANDGLRGTDPSLLEANLDEIVTRLQAHHVRVILAGMLMLPNLGPDYTRAFARIYPSIAEKHDLIFIPFFLEGVAGKRRLNQPDQLHPTAQGYTIVVDTLLPYVLDAIDRHRAG
ncbi:SGNH-hydrolase lipoprotein, lysophospholipase L1-like subgroup [Desulfosarcina cetonica]|uniref:arylesterase n=1 Tax=Desulfosarcina cetonica TaxID=90730 RepID=UPI000A8A2290|nr:arylesterase [Desulfosarcina cetonica]VTR69089.1 SGNH-hydrolase lipoprotein, lysophospholipase L1-like subgroup [Desulfosarcina cetonica]